MARKLVQNLSKSSKSKKTQVEISAKALEVIYPKHIDGKKLLRHLRDQKWGIYKAFVKWHNGDEDDEEDYADVTSRPEGVASSEAHTHVGLILRNKPSNLKIETGAHKKYFEFEGVLPTLVAPLKKPGGNCQPIKKLMTYVSYLCDGHDNGRFKDTWNYKWDHELETCNKDARFLCLVMRGKRLKSILAEADWNTRAYYSKNKNVIDKMINNWKRHVRDDAAHYAVADFKPEVIEDFEDWDPKSQTLILRGPTDLGKTELAKALVQEATGESPILISNLSSLAHRQAHQGFILDDMNFQSMKREKAIHLLDIKNDRGIRILFGVHEVEAGTVRIISTNEDIADLLPYDKHGAIDRRVYVVDVTRHGQLYH